MAVLDYASLYPSSIIENNLSPETDEVKTEIIGYENLNKVYYENFVYKGR